MVPCQCLVDKKKQRHDDHDDASLQNRSFQNYPQSLGVFEIGVGRLLENTRTRANRLRPRGPSLETVRTVWI